MPTKTSVRRTVTTVSQSKKPEKKNPTHTSKMRTTKMRNVKKKSTAPSKELFAEIATIGKKIRRRVKKAL